MAETSKAPETELNALLSEVRGLDMDAVADILGIQKRSGACAFDFFHRHMVFDGQDFFDSNGHDVSLSVKTVYCRYLINCPKEFVAETGRLITFREFPGSGPLFSSFTQNTNKIVEQTFSGKLDLLEQRCRDIGGIPAESVGWDVGFRFWALPRIPIWFHFNEKDDLLPARSAFLFQEQASRYLDIKSLGTLSTYLIGLLIQSPAFPI